MTARGVLLMIGSGLLLAAAVGGLVPLSAEGSSCGTAFIATNDAGADDFAAVLIDGVAGSAEDACESLRSVVLVPLAMVAALGTVPLFTGWALPRPATSPEQQAPSSEETPST